MYSLDHLILRGSGLILSAYLESKTFKERAYANIRGDLNVMG